MSTRPRTDPNGWASVPWPVPVSPSRVLGAAFTFEATPKAFDTEGARRRPFVAGRGRKIHYLEHLADFQ
jgi:hypothetical protein